VINPRFIRTVVVSTLGALLPLSVKFVVGNKAS
jgi:hypothetical protein